MADTQGRRSSLLQGHRLSELNATALSTRFKFALAFVVFVATIAVRLPGTERYVTTDEILWLGRSANFFQALAHGEWANTYQFSHPGVVVTWLGTIGFLLADPGYGFDVVQQYGQFPGYPGALVPTRDVALELERRGVETLDVYIAIRSVMILTFGAVLAALAVTLSRFLGWIAATIAVLLVAFDPFTIALSRVVHLDGMATALLVLAFAQFLAFLWLGRNTSDLVMAGIVGGIACLTRISGLILVPAVGLLLAIELLGCWRLSRRRIVNVLAAARAFAIWGICLAVTFVVFWPAMWTQPLQTLSWTLAVSQDLASGPHVNPVYFNGAVTQDDPGPSFYPLAMLWRTTPVVLLGLSAAVIWPLVPNLRSRIPRVAGRTLLALLLLAAAYLAVVSVEPKKFDRYILPTLLVLTLIAGWGWWEVVAGADAWLRRSSRDAMALTTSGALALLAIAGQIAAAIPAFPYFFSAYNPLLGGAPEASRVMMIGRGEGYDRFSAQVLALPGGPPRTVLAGDPDKLMDFYSGHVVEFPLVMSLDTSSPEVETAMLNDLVLRWATADAFAVYIDQVQRSTLLPGVEEVLARQPLLTTLTLNGLEYAWLYDIESAPLPVIFLGDTSPVVRWGDFLLIMGVGFPHEDGGEESSATMRIIWSGAGKLPTESRTVELIVQVIDPGQLVIASTHETIPFPESLSPAQLDIRFDLPTDAPNGSLIQIAMRDADSGALLAAQRVANGQEIGPFVAVANLYDLEAGRTLMYRPPESGIPSAPMLSELPQSPATDQVTEPVDEPVPVEKRKKQKRDKRRNRERDDSIVSSATE